MLWVLRWDSRFRFVPTTSRCIVQKSPPCVYILVLLSVTEFMLTGQVLWTGPNRRQNETFTEGAPVPCCNCCEDAKWETEHLHGFKQRPHEQHWFVTHPTLTLTLPSKVDLNWYTPVEKSTKPKASDLVTNWTGVVHKEVYPATVGMDLHWSELGLINYSVLCRHCASLDVHKLRRTLG